MEDSGLLSVKASRGSTNQFLGYSRRAQNDGVLLPILVAATALAVSSFLLMRFSQPPLPFSHISSPEGKVDGLIEGVEKNTPESHFLVPITFVNNSNSDGAVCLDGSPPAYHFSPGWGSGKTKWLIYLEGGGWCSDETNCWYRSTTRLGSSKEMSKEVLFEGILSNSSVDNPDFFNWNIVFVRYCDGASYVGNANEPLEKDVEAADPSEPEMPTRKMFFRGLGAWEAVVSELIANGNGGLEAGMQSASHALLAGCSAGGLASLLLCDRFSSILSSASSSVVAVKCLADGGFFLDVADVKGTKHMRNLFSRVVKMQNVSLPQGCTGNFPEKLPWQCFFPEHILPSISTPLFILNSFYDNWQVDNSFAPIPWALKKHFPPIVLEDGADDVVDEWGECRTNLSLCSPPQLLALHGYRSKLLASLHPLLESDSSGSFLSSCSIHCQAMWSATWHSPNAPRIHGFTMAEAVGGWFNGRRFNGGESQLEHPPLNSSWKLMDGPFPDNPTCYDWRKM